MNDSAAIHALFERLTAAWDAGDGAAYGACFTADATYITYVGTLYRGAEEIGAAHQALFDSFLKGTRLACEVIDIRGTGPGIAVVITRGDTYKKAPGRLRKLQTNTVVRRRVARGGLPEHPSQEPHGGRLVQVPARHQARRLTGHPCWRVR
jgi:uncharacterized protein (TIGR02246 family)